MDNKLEPCPFCGGAARIESNRDWHRLYADHTDECFMSAEDHVIMYPASPEYLEMIYEVWNCRAPAPQAAPVQGNSPAQLIGVARSTLQVIYDAMNHMGDALNNMDACEAEDEAATSEAFEAIQNLLTDPFTSHDPAVVQMTDEQKLRLRACIETGVAFDIVSRTDADVILSASGVKHG